MKLIMGGGGGQVIIQKAWPLTILGSLFGECLTPRMLKTSFVDFGKVLVNCSHYKRLNFSSSIQLSILFQCLSKVVDPVDTPFPSFLYSIFYILLNLFSSLI